MAKKESTFLNMTLTLFLVTFISSTILGFVYEITKGPKAKADLEKKISAVKEVLPKFDNNPLDEKQEIEIDGETVTCYLAKLEDKIVGLAIETFSKNGFGGIIKLMVGFNNKGEIYDISVIQHQETPGLGDKMSKNKSNFSNQFKGINPKTFKISVKKDGGDVDGITAATISSRAFCDAVRRSETVYSKILTD